VDVAGDLAASEVLEQWQSERVAHRVNVHVRHATKQSLTTEHQRAYALAEEREEWIGPGLDPRAPLEEHKLDVFWTRWDYVEPLSRGE